MVTLFFYPLQIVIEPKLKKDSYIVYNKTFLINSEIAFVA